MPALQWKTHADLAIKKTPTVGREEYLDYMTFRRNDRPLFTEIFGPVKRETVELIDLPPMATIDQPYAQDEPMLEKELIEKIRSMICRVKDQPDYDDPQAEKIAQDYTWPRIFQRIFSVYEDIIGKRGKDSPVF